MDIKIDADLTFVDQIKEPDKWMKLRTKGIGGSDAGAILGLNKYSSPLVVYMQKKEVKGFMGNDSTEWGHILEDPIRQKTAKELGIQICVVPGMYTSKEYPFMNANLDGVCYADHQITINGEIIEGVGGHEIKTSADGKDFNDDEIPDSYYCQVQHYMAVTQLDWFILTVFILSRKIAKHYVIRKNNDFIYSKLIPAEKDFWENNVLADSVPEPKGMDSEKQYLENLSLDETIKLDEETENIIAEERELDRQIKTLSTKQSELKNKILLKLAELSVGFDRAEKTTAIGNSYRITYNTQIRKSIDTDSLRKAGLYDMYATETASKIMRISEVK